MRQLVLVFKLGPCVTVRIFNCDFVKSRLTRVNLFIIFVYMPIRQKKPIKINGPVINAQGYNIANYLNNHINDYADERFTAYNGTVKIDGHRCKITSDCMPILKLHGCEEMGL